MDGSTSYSHLLQLVILYRKQNYLFTLVSFGCNGKQHNLKHFRGRKGLFGLQFQVTGIHIGTEAASMREQCFLACPSAPAQIAFFYSLEPPS